MKREHYFGYRADPKTTQRIKNAADATGLSAQTIISYSVDFGLPLLETKLKTAGLMTPAQKIKGELAKQP